MIQSTWALIKSLGIALYRNTLGLIKRCADNAAVDKNDDLDKRTAGRMVSYVLFGVFLYVAPHWGITIGILRSLVIMDIIGIVGSMFIDAASIYTKLMQEVSCKNSETSMPPLSPMAAA